MTAGAIAAVVAAVIGAGTAVYQQGQAEDAAEAKRRMDARSLNRQKKQQIRQQQAERAKRVAIASGSGTLDSSGFEGAQAGIGASTAGNIAFQNQLFEGTSNIQETLARGQKVGAYGQALGGLIQAGGFAYDAGMFNAQPNSMQAGAQASGYSPAVMNAWSTGR